MFILFTGMTGLYAAPKNKNSGSSSASDTGLKKVSILPFKNIDQMAGASYLEGSITDAVKDFMRKEFMYEETPAIDILKFAKANYYYEDELWTSTSGMHLGLDMKQDIVIVGGFRMRHKEEKVAGADGGEPKTQAVTMLEIQVTILDIGKQRIIKEFTVDGAADSRLFETIEKLTTRLVREAAGVLPSREDWKGVPLGDLTYNALSFSGGLTYFVSPKFVIPARLSYLKQGFFYHKLAFSFDLEFNYGNEESTASTPGYQLDVNTTGVGFLGVVSIGYDLFRIGKLEIKPFLGGGYSFYIYNFAYKLNGVEGEPGSMNMYAPLAHVGVKVIFPFNRIIAVEGEARYRAYFFPGSMQFVPGGLVGVQFRI